MESAMGAKDAIRALLERLPDDCTVAEVIEHLCRMEDQQGGEAELPPLTAAQRAEIERRLEALDREEEPLVSWRDFLRELERG